MKYHQQYMEGCYAPDGYACPYPIWMLGKRCAWFAGFNDVRAKE